MLRPVLCCTAGGLVAGAVLLTVGFPPVVDRVGPAEHAADAKQLPAKPAAKEIGQLVAHANQHTPPQPAQPAPLALKPGALAPVVIPEGRITIIDKQEVPALRDGQLLVLGTQMPKEQIPPERLIEVRIPNEEQTRYFRRLKEGD